MRILLKNVRVPLTGNTTSEAVIIIEDGVISGISKTAPPLQGFDEIIDGGGGIAVPGAIDIHAHIYDPDYTHHEDFATGSIAAAFGGITTFYDMPLRLYVDSIERLKLKIEAGLKDSFINFSIIAGMMNEANLSSAESLRSEGVKAFKLFTCKPFRPKYDSTLTDVIAKINSLNGLTMIHAEDDSLIDYLTQKFMSEGRHDPLAHHETRPAEGEAAAIRKVAAIAEYLDARIHIVHVSSAEGAEEVRASKCRGAKITAETCPHYLFFTKKDVEKWGNYLKMNPSLKTKEDVDSLWLALSDGTIDAVTSDHAPSPRDGKERDVWEAWGGIPGLETMFPLVFTYGVKKLGLLTLRRYVEVSSINPARIMGIYPRKGALMVGSDADIAVIDPDLCLKVKADNLHHKVDWTPYEGIELCGWPTHVIVNGYSLIMNRELIRENRRPQYIKS